VVCVCGFYTLLGSGFVPRAFAYCIVNLIVSISLCSILPYYAQFNYNVIVIVISYYVIWLIILVITLIYHRIGGISSRTLSSDPDFDISILTSTMIFSPCLEFRVIVILYIY
jgi:hypothetical protein